MSKQLIDLIPFNPTILAAEQAAKDVDKTRDVIILAEQAVCRHAHIGKTWLGVVCLSCGVWDNDSYSHPLLKRHDTFDITPDQFYKRRRVVHT